MCAFLYVSKHVGCLHTRMHVRARTHARTHDYMHSLMRTRTCVLETEPSLPNHPLHEHAGTRAWTAGLELPIEFPWRPWKMGRQVAGHAVRYRAEGEGPLTFATVIGAGHMVPQTSPQNALALLQEFLSDKV